jgi:hypothetical protein
MKKLAYFAGTVLGIGAILLLKKKYALKTSGTANEVINYFTKKGLSKEQATGIAGNLRAESNFKTDAVGDNGKAYGLAQWRDSRLVDLQNYAQNHKKDIRDFYTQLRFLWYELNGKEKQAFAQLKAARTVQDAALAFAKYYERPLASTYDIRINYANQIYNS